MRKKQSLYNESNKSRFPISQEIRVLHFEEKYGTEAPQKPWLSIYFRYVRAKKSPIWFSVPVNTHVDHVVRFESLKPLLRLLLLGRWAHLPVESGIRDLEAGYTADAHVEDRCKDNRDE